MQIIDVKPSSIRYLKEGTRVCAYWSQQFSCLYPGTVAKGKTFHNIFIHRVLLNIFVINNTLNFQISIDFPVHVSSYFFLKKIKLFHMSYFSIIFVFLVLTASPNPHADKGSINVEFDDGDSGRIPLDHIRMLAQDFPLVCKYF